MQCFGIVVDHRTRGETDRKPGALVFVLLVVLRVVIVCLGLLLGFYREKNMFVFSYLSIYLALPSYLSLVAVRSVVSIMISIVYICLFGDEKGHLPIYNNYCLFAFSQATFC